MRLAGRVPREWALTRTLTSKIEASLGEDRRWLAVLAAVTAAELAWWAASWAAGAAPGPWLFTYLGLAFAGLGGAFLLRMLLRRRSPRAAWPGVLIGTAFVGAGASLFLPLKYAIPKLVPFWLDPPLAAAERALLGADPWQVLDRYLGWATLPLDRIYALWLPVQMLALFTVMLEAPSRAKSRALIAYSLAWLVLGVIAATLLASVGPVFYDRLLGGDAFAALHDTLRARGATLALAESDAMWLSLASGEPGLVAGISAVPSLHVAVALWIVLAARAMAPCAAKWALLYFVVIALGSVQLGWHYVADGLAGALGMLAIWAAAGKVDGFRRPAIGQGAG